MTNANASGLSAGNQYMGAVPALVTEALSKVAYTYVHLSNMNSLMGAFEANKQLQATNDEADKQRQEGWANAIGQIALGATQIVAGGVQMGGAAYGLSSLPEEKEIAGQIENATAYKKALDSRAAENSSLTDADEDVPKASSEVAERMENMIEDNDFRNKPDETFALGSNEEISDLQLINEMDPGDAEGLSAQVGQKIQSLNTQKSNLEGKRQGVIKMTEGISLGLQGAGHATQGVFSGLAGQLKASATILATLGQLASRLMNNFDNQSQSDAQMIQQVFQELTDLARSAN